MGRSDEGQFQRRTPMLRYCRLPLLIPFLFLFFFQTSIYAEQPAQDSDSARVLSLETLWNQAEVDKDASALDHLLAENFTFVDIDGSLKNKAEFLDSIKHPPEHIETIGNESLKARVHQDVVIVIGTYHERGTLNGKGYYHHGRFTDTWVRQGSSWMCIASQSTLIQQ
jgi:ketosteroid isomerase-like protein